MSSYELIATILAVLSLILAGVSFFRTTDLTKKYNDMVAQQTNLIGAQVELLINERITSTKNSVQDFIAKMPLDTELDAQPAQKTRLLQILNSLIENNLNAYEEACAKYIDNKVDRDRFKKMYKVEIRNLVEKEELEIYFNGVKSRYKAILKVYKEWEDLEG
ncbi:hypothetical protein [Bacillus cereus]|uniref:hypothetical protein n=1 Tax=Bacillus cereus TaxID=1396 RepID=UPI0012F8B056|nr:hypothetical protein [Bacillus cereus]